MHKRLYIWRTIRKVRMIRNSSGYDVFNINDLTKDKEYEVYGITFKIYSDGTREPCYLIKNDKGVLCLKSISLFEITEG